MIRYVVARGLNKMRPPHRASRDLLQRNLHYGRRHRVRALQLLTTRHPSRDDDCHNISPALPVSCLLILTHYYKKFRKISASTPMRVNLVLKFARLPRRLFARRDSSPVVSIPQTRANRINFAITAVIKSFMYLSLRISRVSLSLSLSLRAPLRLVFAFPECFRVEVISVAITRILDTLPTLCTDRAGRGCIVADYGAADTKSRGAASGSNRANENRDLRDAGSFRPASFSRLRRVHPACIALSGCRGGGATKA